MKKAGEVATQIVDLLSPFEAEEQRRIVSAAMMLLGNSEAVEPPASAVHTPSGGASGSGKRDGTINVVTAKLGADSCRKILMAAAVHLSIFDGKGKWSRDEWTTRAGESRDWKSVYSNQMSRDIGRLVKSGSIIENSADVFSLSTAALTEAETKFR